MKRQPQTLREIEDAYVKKQRLNERHGRILCLLLARKGDVADEDILREAGMGGPWRKRVLEQLARKSLVGYVDGCVRLTYAGEFVAGVLVRRQSQRKA